MTVEHEMINVRNELPWTLHRMHHKRQPLQQQTSAVQPALLSGCPLHQSTGHNCDVVNLQLSTMTSKMTANVLSTTQLVGHKSSELMPAGTGTGIFQAGSSRWPMKHSQLFRPVAAEACWRHILWSWEWPVQQRLDPPVHHKLVPASHCRSLAVYELKHTEAVRIAMRPCESDGGGDIHASISSSPNKSAGDGSMCCLVHLHHSLTF